MAKQLPPSIGEFTKVKKDFETALKEITKRDETIKALMVELAAAKKAAGSPAPAAKPSTKAPTPEPDGGAFGEW